MVRWTVMCRPHPCAARRATVRSPHKPSWTSTSSASIPWDRRESTAAPTARTPATARTMSPCMRERTLESGRSCAKPARKHSNNRIPLRATCWSTRETSLTSALTVAGVSPIRRTCRVTANCSTWMTMQPQISVPTAKGGSANRLTSTSSTC
ncbi:hypothetical protein V5799_012775 [Amblyomma americanum]|uniref:Uncharacterized protein n=1 Tax=Amblyomma americanum TaxID=6943 RepID=A0AAQ4E7P7_AMBAM